MDSQSALVLERVMNQRGKGQIHKDLIGGSWEGSPFSEFKTLSPPQIGLWGEFMFEESFGYKCESRGLDLPSLNADVKTFTRAYKATKFSGNASIHLNPDRYFMYLIFPDHYRLYCVPRDDECIRIYKAWKNHHVGSVDIGRSALERFEQLNYDSFSVGENGVAEQNKNTTLEIFLN